MKIFAASLGFCHGEKRIDFLGALTSGDFSGITFVFKDTFFHILRGERDHLRRDTF